MADSAIYNTQIAFFIRTGIAFSYASHPLCIYAVFCFTSENIFSVDLYCNAGLGNAYLFTDGQTLPLSLLMW